MSDIVNSLRNEILAQLRNVTAENSPNIYRRIQANYKVLEEEIISRVIATGMQPAAVIPQMEMESDEI